MAVILVNLQWGQVCPKSSKITGFGWKLNFSVISLMFSLIFDLSNLISCDELTVSLIIMRDCFFYCITIVHAVRYFDIYSHSLNI